MSAAFPREQRRADGLGRFDDPIPDDGVNFDRDVIPSNGFLLLNRRSDDALVDHDLPLDERERLCRN